MKVFIVIYMEYGEYDEILQVFNLFEKADLFVEKKRGFDEFSLEVEYGKDECAIHIWDHHAGRFGYIIVEKEVI